MVLEQGPTTTGRDLSQVFHITVEVFLELQYGVWLTFGCKCVSDVLIDVTD